MTIWKNTKWKTIPVNLFSWDNNITPKQTKQIVEYKCSYISTLRRWLWWKSKYKSIYIQFICFVCLVVIFNLNKMNSFGLSSILHVCPMFLIKIFFPGAWKKPKMSTAFQESGTLHVPKWFIFIFPVKKAVKRLFWTDFPIFHLEPLFTQQFQSKNCS